MQKSMSDILSEQMTVDAQNRKLIDEAYQKDRQGTDTFYTIIWCLLIVTLVIYFVKGLRR